MQYPSLNSVHPLTSNGRGREKRAAKVGGVGRGFKRPASAFVPTLMQLPVAAPPSPTSVRVGQRVTGAFCCPACRTRTTTLVRQLPTSSMAWVCADWCSPRDPRTTPFTSTQETNR